MIGMIQQYISDLRREFGGYTGARFSADLLAGVTVAAVALPLALAFGVGSGADAAAGLITAIVAAFLIGALSGAPFQISGPTGAMAAILIPLAGRYGLKTVLAAGMLSGVMLLVAGFCRLGRVVSFLPKSVITGFTSGIALIIALGQVENLLGVGSHGEQAYMRVANIFRSGLAPNYHSLAIGACIIALMLVWPKRWGAKVPASLVAVIAATAAQMLFGFPVDTVGEIPRTLIHGVRLLPQDMLSIKWDIVVLPAISIAALGMIESLLCGAVAGKMSGDRLRADRELVAQGLGNIVLPFFGGVPATAAIARTSVAIKSGGKTRLTGLLHGAMLLMSMFLLSPFMSQIPMAALAGVLMVTAWRMNEWDSIRYIFKGRFKSAAVKFGVTLLCTVAFDLTVAIGVGCLLSMLFFIAKMSELEVTVSEFDPDRVSRDIVLSCHVQVIYVTGPIFFGSADAFAEKARAARGKALIFSMRGVPSVDTSGAQEILHFCVERKNAGVTVMFSGLQPKVREMFDRSGITAAVGEQNFFWVAEDALWALNEV